MTYLGLFNVPLEICITINITLSILPPMEWSLCKQLQGTTNPEPGNWTRKLDYLSDSIKNDPFTISLEALDGTLLCRGFLIKPNVVLTTTRCISTTHDLVRARAHHQVLDVKKSFTHHLKLDSGASGVTLLVLNGSVDVNDEDQKTIDRDLFTSDGAFSSDKLGRFLMQIGILEKLDQKTIVEIQKMYTFILSTVEKLG